MLYSSRRDSLISYIFGNCGLDIVWMWVGRVCSVKHTQGIMESGSAYILLGVRE